MSLTGEYCTIGSGIDIEVVCRHLPYFEVEFETEALFEHLIGVGTASNDDLVAFENITLPIGIFGVYFPHVFIGLAWNQILDLYLLLCISSIVLCESR